MDWRGLGLGLGVLLLLAGTAPSAHACDCSGGSSKGAGAAPGNSLLPGQTRPSTSTSTLDDVLTPELVQSYLTLQLHRAAIDMADRVQARSPSTPCSQATPCGPALRRVRRFTTGVRGEPDDVPVVAGLKGQVTPRSPLLALLPKAPRNDDSNDVPVFKGTHEGTPLVRVITPSPTAIAGARSAAATTVPTVPVVKGAPDPAHPTAKPGPSRVPLVPGNLQLTPEEEEALAVLLEGRQYKPSPARPRPPPRPAGPARPALRPTRPTAVSAISGKVGGRTAPSLVPTTQTTTTSGGSGGSGNCCTRTRLLQELERQLAVLRQMNADHLREEWVRASYPSPYYPYLHNLPVHPARGYDGAPALLPAYFLPSSGSPGWSGRSGWRGRDPTDPAVPFGASPPTPGSWRAAATPNCNKDVSDDDEDAEDGGELDDKVRFGEQREQLRELDDLQGDDPHDDVGVDPKISQPVDFEIR